MRLHLDLLEERRDKVQTTTAAYQLRTGQYFNKMVRQQCFGVGDWILQKVTLATWDPADTNLGHKWEGPYQVIRSQRTGAYYLRAIDGRPLPQPWNAEHLKRLSVMSSVLFFDSCISSYVVIFPLSCDVINEIKDFQKLLLSIENWTSNKPF